MDIDRCMRVILIGEVVHDFMCRHERDVSRGCVESYVRLINPVHGKSMKCGKAGDYGGSKGAPRRSQWCHKIEVDNVISVISNGVDRTSEMRLDDTFISGQGRIRCIIRIVVEETRDVPEERADRIHNQPRKFNDADTRDGQVRPRKDHCSVNLFSCPYWTVCANRIERRRPCTDVDEWLAAFSCSVPAIAVGVSIVEPVVACSDIWCGRVSIMIIPDIPPGLVEDVDLDSEVMS